MPIQIWTHDRSPELRLAGADRLAAGISGGVQSIARGFEKRQEERKRLAQAGKAADAFYKALPADALPIPAEDWALLSPVDKASAMQGIIGAQHYERGVADTKRLLAAVAMEREQEANLARAPKFLEDVARYAPPGDLPQNLQPADYGLPEGQLQPGLREFAASAGRTGYTPKLSEFDDLLRAAAGPHEGAAFFKPEQFGQAFPVTTREGKTLPGIYTTPLGPRASQVITDPSQSLETQEITDSAGNSYTVLVPPKGAIKELRPKGEVTELDRFRSLTQRYTALIGRRKYDEANKVLAELTALGAGGSAGTGTAATVAAPMELPRTAAGKIEPGKLTKGTRYNSPQGVVTWNGEKFVKE